MPKCEEPSGSIHVRSHLRPLPQFAGSLLAGASASGARPHLHQGCRAILNNRCVECHRAAKRRRWRSPPTRRSGRGRRRSRSAPSCARCRRGWPIRRTHLQERPSLPDSEIATSAAWVNVARRRAIPATCRRRRNSRPGWNIGKPDATFDIGTDFDGMPARAPWPYKVLTVVLFTNLRPKGQMGLQAAEVASGPSAAAGITHPCSLQRAGGGQKADGRPAQGRKACWWLMRRAKPALTFTRDGTAVLAPDRRWCSGTLQRRAGKALKDRSYMALKFASETPRYRRCSGTGARCSEMIRAGDPNPTR